jgi:hypothetical protein
MSRVTNVASQADLPKSNAARIFIKSTTDLHHNEHHTQPATSIETPNSFNTPIQKKPFLPHQFTHPKYSSTSSILTPSHQHR